MQRHREGRLGARRVGNGSEEECGEEGRASHPFIGPEGGAGRPDGERDRSAVECAINGLHTFGFWEGKGGGKRGVKRGRVRCRFWERRGCRAVRARARGGAVGFSRRKNQAGPTWQWEERVEAAGPAKGQGPVGSEAGGWAWGEGGGPGVTSRNSHFGM
jgi:hypothetical protein